jgi:RimJ/RimL family protein N-acetyltransferase
MKLRPSVQSVQSVVSRRKAQAWSQERLQMIPLSTARLLLRNFSVADAAALHALVNQYAAGPYAAYDQPWPTSLAEVTGVTEWFAGGDSYLAVCLQERGQFIGFVALNPESPAEERAFNLGYVFDAGLHSRGYATEACQALLDHAFGQLDAQRVCSGTAAANLPSCRLLARLGFQKTAESMVSFQTAADGTPIEFLGCTFVLLREEWAHRAPGV